MSRQDSHENLARKDDVKSGSDRFFGVVFAIVFALIGLWPLLDAEPLRVWAIGCSLTLLMIALAAPRILAPLNRLWFLFGQLLHKIVNPIIMALLFFTTVTPIALIMRLLSKRPLPLDFDPEAKSYWIEREPPGPEPETMTRQF
jgi:hypothetical protein